MSQPSTKPNSTGTQLKVCVCSRNKPDLQLCIRPVGLCDCSPAPNSLAWRPTCPGGLYSGSCLILGSSPPSLCDRLHFVWKWLRGKSWRFYRDAGLGKKWEAELVGPLTLYGRSGPRRWKTMDVARTCWKYIFFERQYMEYQRSLKISTELMIDMKKSDFRIIFFWSTIITHIRELIY